MLIDFYAMQKKNFPHYETNCYLIDIKCSAV